MGGIFSKPKPPPPQPTPPPAIDARQIAPPPEADTSRAVGGTIMTSPQGLAPASTSKKALLGQ